MSDKKSSKDGQEAKNWLEWTFVIAGALVIAGLLGYLAWTMTGDQPGPPDLSASILDSTTTDEATGYRVEVQNHGGTAEDVKVEICDQRDRCATHLFRYVPLESSREAIIILEKPARPVVARVVSYRKM